MANGCAIEAYRLSGRAEHALPTARVRDVTSFDIGVVAAKPNDPSGRLYICTMIPKGTPLSAEVSRQFGMMSGSPETGQQAELILAEGRDQAEYDEKSKVQAFSLAEFPPSDDPTQKVLEVSIRVNESGIIRSEAVHLPTGNKIENQVNRKAIA